MRADDSRYDFMKKWAPAARDGFLGTIGIVTLVLAVKLTYDGKLQAGGILLTAGLLMAMVSGLSRFKSIKALGIDAQLHELGEKISEADRLFKHVKEIVGLTADVTFQVMGQTRRQDVAFSRRDALEIADAFRQQMKSLGEDKKSIEAHMRPWHKSNLRELLQPVHALAVEYSQLQTQEANRESFNFPHDAPANDKFRLANEARAAQNTNFIVAINKLWGGDEFVYVSTIESTIQKSSCGSEAERRTLTEKIEIELDIARYYAENLDFKNRETWVNSRASSIFDDL